MTIIFTSIFIECSWKHIASRNQELTWFLIPCSQNARNENRDSQHTVRVVLIFYLLVSVLLLAILCLQPSTCNLTTIQAFGLKLWCFLYAECHYQGERQGLVCVNVAGVNDIGNASPVSIGTVRNSGKN